jgi:hypothetical protein
MTEPSTDPLSPAGKDPAEGPEIGAPRSPPPSYHPEETHLGAAGDPAEGRNWDEP